MRDGGGSGGCVDIRIGDALEGLRGLSDNSVDSMVTDPPAGIGFMGKEWDKDKGGRDQWIAWLTEVMAEAYRVMKPGSHGLVWALPRTSHWTAMALEDAGFEIRDRIGHIFGSGFPKSHNISKAIDKKMGIEHPANELISNNGSMAGGNYTRHKIDVQSDLAKQWDGWGTALKPAIEDWWLIRKPFSGTVADNVLQWGTGGLNIDGCRIEANDGYEKQWDKPISTNISFDKYVGSSGTRKVDLSTFRPDSGRFPANLIHDGSDEVTELFPNNASRFFYCAKASRRDRDDGLDGFEAQDLVRQGLAGEHNNPQHKNIHPTVKPFALMSYLVRLITPPNGVVLDPFMGSGSTGKAAIAEGFDFIGIELSEEYAKIAEARIGYQESYCK